MLFPQLEKYKNPGGEPDARLDKVTHFLTDIWRESGSTDNLFDYKRFANECSLSKEPALATLFMCEKEGILQAVYYFHCPEKDAYIEEYLSLSEVPEVLNCWYHEREIEHPSIECPVDILFKFTPTFAQKMKENS